MVAYCRSFSRCCRFKSKIIFRRDSLDQVGYSEAYDNVLILAFFLRLYCIKNFHSRLKLGNFLLRSISLVIALSALFPHDVCRRIDVFMNEDFISLAYRLTVSASSLCRLFLAMSRLFPILMNSHRSLRPLTLR